MFVFNCFYLIYLIISLQLAIGKIALLVGSEVVIQTAPLKHWNHYQLRSKSELPDKPNSWISKWLRCALSFHLHNKFNYSIISQHDTGLAGCQAAIPSAMTPKSAAPYSQLCTQGAVSNHCQVMWNHSKKTMAQVLYPYPFPGAQFQPIF